MYFYFQCFPEYHGTLSRKYLASYTLRAAEISVINILNRVPDPVRYWWQSERWFQTIIHCENCTQPDQRNSFKTGFKDRANARMPGNEPSCPPAHVPMLNRGHVCCSAKCTCCPGPSTAAGMRNEEGETVPPCTCFWRVHTSLWAFYSWPKCSMNKSSKQLYKALVFLTFASMGASKLASKCALGSSKAFRKDLTLSFSCLSSTSSSNPGYCFFLED